MDFSNANDTLIETFGENLVYQHNAGGAAYSVRGIVDGGPRIESEQGIHATVTARVDAFSASPQKGDMVTLPDIATVSSIVNAGEYCVRKQEPDGRGMTVLSLARVRPQ